MAATGMSAVAWMPHAKTDDNDKHRRQQVLFTTASGIALLIGFILHVVLAGGFAPAWRLLGSHASASMPWPEIAAYFAAALLGARFVVVKAWFAARNLRPDMHLLMTSPSLARWHSANGSRPQRYHSFLHLTDAGELECRAGTAGDRGALDLAPPTARVLRPDGSRRNGPG